MALLASGYGDIVLTVYHSDFGGSVVELLPRRRQQRLEQPRRCRSWGPLDKPDVLPSMVLVEAGVDVALDSQNLGEGKEVDGGVVVGDLLTFGSTFLVLAFAG